MSRDIREVGTVHKALTAPCHHLWLKEVEVDGMMAELGRVKAGGGRLPMQRRSHIILLHLTGLLASGTRERNV
jgi:hypothetical protein